MNFDSLRPDRSLLDFHDPFTTPRKLEVDILLIEWLADGFFPKAYLCPSASKKSGAVSEFVLLGEVREFQRGIKTLFLKDGTTVYYQHLVIVSQTNSEQKKDEEFHKALHSLLDAIRINEKGEVRDKMSSSPLESIRKLRGMIQTNTQNGNESLDTIKNVNQQTCTREPHNRLFELHL